jgi:hypothetical protein
MDKIWRKFLPYCVVQLHSGNWIFLNRKYKPLGTFSDDHVDYEKSETIFEFKKNPTKTLTDNAINSNEGKEGIYYFLFNDGCVPYSNTKSTNDYFCKLEKIMKLQIKDKK